MPHRSQRSATSCENLITSPTATLAALIETVDEVFSSATQMMSSLVEANVTEAEITGHGMNIVNDIGDPDEELKAQEETTEIQKGVASPGRHYTPEEVKAYCAQRGIPTSKL